MHADAPVWVYRCVCIHRFACLATLDRSFVDSVVCNYAVASICERKRTPTRTHAYVFTCRYGRVLKMWTCKAPPSAAHTHVDPGSQQADDGDHRYSDSTAGERKSNSRSELEAASPAVLSPASSLSSKAASPWVFRCLVRVFLTHRETSCPCSHTKHNAYETFVSNVFIERSCEYLYHASILDATQLQEFFLPGALPLMIAHDKALVGSSQNTGTHSTGALIALPVGITFCRSAYDACTRTLTAFPVRWRMVDIRKHLANWHTTPVMSAAPFPGPIPNSGSPWYSNEQRATATTESAPRSTNTYTHGGAARCDTSDLARANAAHAKSPGLHDMLMELHRLESVNVNASEQYSVQDIHDGRVAYQQLCRRLMVALGKNPAFPQSFSTSHYITREKEAGENTRMGQSKAEISQTIHVDI